jgi:hypothetical protein
MTQVRPSVHTPPSTAKKQWLPLDEHAQGPKFNAQHSQKKKVFLKITFRDDSTM